MYSTKGLKVINGVVVANTKQFGWRSIIGFRVQLMIYEGDKPRFLEGRIARISGDSVQIKIPSYRPGIDDKSYVVKFSDPWEIIGLPIEKPVVLELQKEVSVGPRCENTREAVHPATFKKTTLQCVMRLGHGAGHHYENPSNKVRKQ